MYVLDTNTLIYFFKGMGSVAQRLLDVSPAQIAIPAIVIYELETGIAKSCSPAKRRGQLAEMAAAVTVLPFGMEEARCAATIRADLEEQGVPIGPYDTLIAGTALAHSAILVTHNTAEFSRIRNLLVEDWY